MKSAKCEIKYLMLQYAERNNAKSWWLLQIATAAIFVERETKEKLQLDSTSSSNFTKL